MVIPIWLVRTLMALAAITGVALLGLFGYDIIMHRLPDLLTNHPGIVAICVGFAIACIAFRIGLQYLIEFDERDKQRRREG